MSRGPAPISSGVSTAGAKAVWPSAVPPSADTIRNAARGDRKSERCIAILPSSEEPSPKGSVFHRWLDRRGNAGSRTVQLRSNPRYDGIEVDRTQSAACPFSGKSRFGLIPLERWDQLALRML